MSEEQTPSLGTSLPDAGDGAESTAPAQEGRALDERGGNGLGREAGSIAELEDGLRWAMADLDNMRKRFERELARKRAEERAAVAAEWLPVLDNLERALDHAGADAGALGEGIRAVRDQAVRVLARLGFSRYDDLGCPFDPARDEAIGTVFDDSAPGTIVAAPRPGYASAERVLRPAGVIASKGRD